MEKKLVSFKQKIDKIFLFSVAIVQRKTRAEAEELVKKLLDNPERR